MKQIMILLAVLIAGTMLVSATPAQCWVPVNQCYNFVPDCYSMPTYSYDCPSAWNYTVIQQPYYSYCPDVYSSITYMSAPSTSLISKLTPVAISKPKPRPVMQLPPVIKPRIAPLREKAPRERPRPTVPKPPLHYRPNPEDISPRPVLASLR